MTERKRRTSKKTTLADVAREVGVTAATVSYVLNGLHTKRISAITRAKILAAARRLKYTPDSHARSLVTGKNLSIAAYFPHRIEYAMSDPYSAFLLRGIVQKCALNDYSLQVLIEGHNLSQPSVDGWICIMPSKPMDHSLLKNKPLIYLDPAKHVGEWSLHADNVGAARVLSNHLRKTAQKTLFVFGSSSYISAQIHKMRFEWLVAGLEDASQVSPFNLNNSMAAAANSVIAPAAVAHAIDKKFDTIVAATDELGAQIVSELIRRGISIPGDIQVASYDSTGFGHICAPTLTTVDLGTQELGYRCANLLLDRITSNISKERGLLVGPPSPVLRKGGTTR